MRFSRSDDGQTTVEFALTLLMAMAVVFFYIQLCLVLAWSSYVQYATFMSARAYYAATKTPDDQQARAEEVLAKMVKRGSQSKSTDRIPFIARGEGDGDMKGAQIGPHEKFKADDRSFSWLEGVRYTFRSRIFMIPMGGSEKDSRVNSVTLTSESWLGREPTIDECVLDLEKFGRAVVDNGC